MPKATFCLISLASLSAFTIALPLTLAPLLSSNNIVLFFLLTLFRYLPDSHRGVIENAPVQFLTLDTLQSLLKNESYYGNYDFHVPRTRAFLSHKRSSAQGVAGRIWQELKKDYNIFLDSEAQFDLHGKYFDFC